MKKKITSLLILICLFMCVEPNVAEAESSAACFIDVGSGRVLYAYNEDEIRQIASTTKIMTAVIAIENSDPAQQVVISDNAASTGGSSIGLRAGDTISMGDLIAATLFVSGNDGACAIAETVAGSVEAFAAMMNLKASLLGCKNTHFCNPHGLPDSEHYSTAHDLALIAAYAIQNETFRGITSAKSIEITVNGKPWTLRNKDELLNIYDYAIGIKTEYTDAAGRCFVSAAEKDGMIICGVLLDSDSIFEESKAKLEELFSAYENSKVISAGSIMCDIAVKNSDIRKVRITADKDYYVPLKADEECRVTYDTVDFISAPAQSGTPVGMLLIKANGEIVATDIIRLNDDVPSKKLTADNFCAYMKLLLKLIV